MARQFPHVKYLEILFPEENSLFISCLKSLLSLDDKQEKRCYWPELISFYTKLVDEQFESIYHESKLCLWLIKNTDLKYVSYSFHVDHSPSIFSIWF